MAGNKDLFLASEVVHTNHKNEFLRFFEGHKRLCDEISGLKVIRFGDEKVRITRDNFHIAINRLNAFIIDFIVYVGDKAKRDIVDAEFKKLEDEFSNDKEYNSFAKLGGDLTKTKHILFTKSYINYVVKCFEVAHLLSKYLQSSLNISSREIVKSLQFVNYDAFFNNLSAYRDEISNDLSNLSFNTLFDNYKKLLGYFYTYRYMVGKNEDALIVKLLKSVYGYMCDDSVINYIVKINSGEDVSNSVRLGFNADLMKLRDGFNKVYFLVNLSLSMRNILPKSRKEVLVDNTLI